MMAWVMLVRCPRVCTGEEVDGIGTAEVPVHCPGNATLGLGDPGFGVGGVHAGLEVNGIGAAKVPVQHTNKVVSGSKDHSSRVGVHGGEGVVGRRENN